jgi:hypothetical protein
MKKTLFIFSILLLFIFGNSLLLEKNAVGALIDFETSLANPNPADKQEITNQYSAMNFGGVTFSTPSGKPRLEAVGGPVTPNFPSPPGDEFPGFINDANFFSTPNKVEPYEDTEAAGYVGQLGNFFLRLGVLPLLTDSPAPVLRIDYATPVSGAKAEIWDIDAWDDGSKVNTEQWLVLAFDQFGNVNDTITSPLGLEFDDSLGNSLDGKPWEWSFDHGTKADIYSIQIVWDSSAKYAKTSGIGLAFDNFNTTAVPIPAAIWLFGSGILGMVFIRRKLKN